MKPLGTVGGPSAPSAQPERPSPEPRLEALLEQRMAWQRLIPGGSLVVVEGTRIGEVREHLSARRCHLVLVVDRALLPVGTLHEAEIMDVFQELGPRAAVEEVLDR